MRQDVFQAALRATAKLALSMVVVSGCASTAGSEDTNSSEADVKASNKYAKDAGASCDELLTTLDTEFKAWIAVKNNADAGPADHPERPLVSAETTACCRTDLAAKGFRAPHREACCQLAVSWMEEIQDGGDPKVANACTPWGPPVPPAMKRAKKTSRLEAVIA
jgi:hypothetical protein